MPTSKRLVPDVLRGDQGLLSCQVYVSAAGTKDRRDSRVGVLVRWPGGPRARALLPGLGGAVWPRRLYRRDRQGPGEPEGLRQHTGLINPGRCTGGRMKRGSGWCPRLGNGPRQTHVHAELAGEGGDHCRCRLDSNRHAGIGHVSAQFHGPERTDSGRAGGASNRPAGFSAAVARPGRLESAPFWLTSVQPLSPASAHGSIPRGHNAGEGSDRDDDGSAGPR
jgi:hypothetical protein